MESPPTGVCPSPVERARTALVRRLGVDTRALATFRAALALTLLVDLVLRSADLVAFHTDRGVLPRSALADQYPLAAKLSIHAVSGTAWFQALLFAVAACGAVALLVGFRTRVAAVLSWYLLVSVQARNPLVLDAGDALLAVLLSLGLLLPLGERWSVDALGRSDRERRVVGVASTTILLQVVAVYAINVAFKFRGDLWPAGEALGYVFRLDQFTILLGDVLAGYPSVLAALTYAWLALLAASPLLLVLTGRARTALVLAFLLAHAGMFLTVSVGLFPLALSAGVSLFLPSRAWDAVERKLSPLSEVFALDWWANVLTVLRARSPGPYARFPSAAWRRRLAPVLCAVVLVSLLAWNVGSLGYARPTAQVDGAESGEFEWAMFAPDLPDSYGWYSVSVDLESGRQVNALDRSVADWYDPPDAARTYPNVRWRTFMPHVRGDDGHDERLADYACRRVETRYDAAPERVTISYYERPVYANAVGSTDLVQFREYRC